MAERRDVYVTVHFETTTPHLARFIEEFETWLALTYGENVARTWWTSAEVDDTHALRSADVRTVWLDNGGPEHTYDPGCPVGALYVRGKVGGRV